MSTYIVRYEVPGEFSQISEPVEAETPREAAKAVIQRGSGPIGGLVDQIPNDEVLTVHELVAADEMTINDITEDND